MLFVMIVIVWLELLTMSFPTDLIEAIIDWVALLTPTDKEPGLKASTLSSCALSSPAFVFPFLKHIFRTIDLGARLPRGLYYVHFYRLLLLNLYLGTHFRHLRLFVDTENSFLPMESRGSRI